VPILLKLYFGDLLDPEILIEHIRVVRAEATALKRRLEAQPAEVRAESVFADLTVRHGLEWARAMIRWAASAEQELTARLTATHV
jgi:hypothetical protein